ncbi:transposase [Paenibacillus gansuensis]|uniref:Transposase n=1 Tax=Paenibacillus gansuensis TaxID=306542 RepID=A0ABW5PEP5_9BACL
MNDETLVKCLYQNVVKDNLEIYRGIFTNTDRKTVTDPHWRKALKLYSELSDENKEILYKIIKQVQVDTASTLLGIFDGVVSISELADLDVKITVQGNAYAVNGDLQDLFLSLDEENR